MKGTMYFFVWTYFVASGIAFVVGTGSADPDDFRKMTAPARKKCIKETKTTIQAIEDAEYGKFPEDDEKLKCYFKCVLGKFNIMDNSGKIKYNMLKKVVPEPYKEVAFDMIDSCVNPSGKDNCDKAYNFMKCMYSANPMVFIAP
ncbi:odorant binding protein 11 [Colletes latitarsis]|uniref:odorant binding protein 11 n=1 Tax=Colletes latitarsis TaxID=2605962 RepID=UPI004036D475